MSDFIKAERVVRTALALLEREVTLAATVWRDAAGDFAGAKDDTITMRLPAYTKADKNALRSGAARNRRGLFERKVDVSLTDRLYRDVELDDETLTLDIENFTTQVMAPVLRALVQGYEDEVAALMDGGTYEVELDLNEADPLKTLRAARKALNKANVPQSQRFLAVGADLEEFILNATTVQENIARTGDDSALRDAEMGRLAGFQPFVSNSIDPAAGFAYHRTAYVLNTKAPKVPAGAPWGASESRGGFALRAVQVLDPDTITNILATEGWVGTNVVADVGEIDSLTGQFEPAEDPDESGAAELFVRAVKIGVGS